MSELPGPLVPPDADIRGFPFIPIDVTRLVTSETWIMSTGDEAKAAMTLWLQSWQQVPAGSVPDNDRVLAHLSMAGPMWPVVKEMALRGWVKCNDGRLYHPVVCEKVHEALKSQQQRKAAISKRWAKKDKPSPDPEKQVVEQTEKQTEKQVETRNEVRTEYEPDTGRIRDELQPEVRNVIQQTLTQTQIQKEEDIRPYGLVPYGTPEPRPASQVTAFVDVWNEVCGDALTKVFKLTDQRKKTITKRLKEDFGNDLEQWRAFCERVRASDHMTGHNDRGWKASFDWVLEPKNLAKTMEGNYDNRSRSANLFAFPGGQRNGNSFADLRRRIAEQGVG